MGIYLNPGNEGFATARRSRYIDKSGLIFLINERIDTKQKLVCMSRPRRFGKSIAAQMLSAYYDRSCDSSMLFQDLSIAKKESYKKHLNKYDVICIDMAQVISESGDKTDIIRYLQKKVIDEIRDMFPDASNGDSLLEVMSNAVNHTKNKFIAIIDEWDAPIRDPDFTVNMQNEYLAFLKMLFKSGWGTDRIFAAAYMTGILPIKKDGSQSAISEFEEYNMLGQGEFEPYVGFTEEEVRTLCEEYGTDF
nr:AAA family ATPase [Lachnospiraceae bacterium]